ncbi:DUF4339 domain-containing protein [Simkania negevensis]|uniref:GYF domain-containing protein n=1 Tax=Simkania negevensis (strain ATCC VR-1471 / DSM 27360 / Z) TaxID=331113 RepID=F8L372_SIMNZ|nr:DUF4339 domain-containing protein [Simkania negevensis]CCB89710.1 hypothetical protein SNE_A18330 [Simkania negevensis Z]
MFSYLSLFFLLIIGAVCAYNAKLRGRSPIAWFAIGLFLGAIGLLILYLLPPKREPLSSVATSSSAKPMPEITPQVTPSLAQQTPAATPQKLWYYLDEDNERHGPMSFDRLKSAWIEDQVTRETYLWNEDMEDWKVVKDLPDLLDELGEINSPNND